MIIGRVVGNIHATIKKPCYQGRKLLLVQPVALDLTPLHDLIVAVDSVDAGEGDLVLVAQEGRAAADILGMKEVAVRSVVVGVIDHFDVAETAKG